MKRILMQVLGCSFVVVATICSNTARSETLVDQASLFRNSIYEAFQDKQTFTNEEVEEFIRVVFGQNQGEPAIQFFSRWQDQIRFGIINSALVADKSDVIEVAINLNLALVSRFVSAKQVQKNPNLIFIFSDNIFEDTRGKYFDVFSASMNGNNLAKQELVERIVQDQERRNASCFSYIAFKQSYDRGSSVIIIDSKLNEKQLSRCVSLEMLRGFGLLGPSSDPNSLLHPESTKSYPQAVDIKNVIALYDARLKLGMGVGAVKESLMQFNED